MSTATAAEHGRHKANPRYPANIREFARRLYQSGWSAYKIRQNLIARGYDPVPSQNTILCWVDDEYREIQRLNQRRFRPAGPKRARAWEARLDRMRQLRDAGLSFSSIAIVMTLDFENVDLSTEQVRYMLKGHAKTATIKRLLWPKGEQG
jgi:hypothetical protein